MHVVSPYNQYVSVFTDVVFEDLGVQLLVQSPLNFKARFMYLKKTNPARIIFVILR